MNRPRRAEKPEDVPDHSAAQKLLQLEYREPPRREYDEHPQREYHELPRRGYPKPYRRPYAG